MSEEILKDKINSGKQFYFSQSFLVDLDKASYEEILESINQIQIKAQQDWYALYQLFNAIERRELYLPQFKSMTAWLNNYCADKRHGLSVDRAFIIKRAGKVLTDFMNRNNLDYKELNYIPPQTLTNIDKAVRCEIGISQDKEKDLKIRRDELIQKANTGNLSRDESVRLYKRARYQKKREKELEGGNNREDREKIKRNTAMADELKSAICNHWSWLGEKQKRWGRSNFERKKDNRIRDYYRGIEEFAFSVTGEEHGRKQADVLICENLTSRNPVEATTHAIEIKVDVDDFRRDTKYVDYLNYVDYLWLFAPNTVLDQIDSSEIPDRIGVLGYKEGSVYKVRDALENEEADVEGTLRRLAVHLH